MNNGTCTKVQDKMWRQNSVETGLRGRERTFTVAHGDEIAHTVTIETIKYR